MMSAQTWRRQERKQPMCRHPMPPSYAAILCRHPMPPSHAAILCRHPMPPSHAAILCRHPMPPMTRTSPAMQAKYTHRCVSQLPAAPVRLSLGHATDGEKADIARLQPARGTRAEARYSLHVLCQALMHGSCGSRTYLPLD